MDFKTKPGAERAEVAGTTRLNLLTEQIIGAAIEVHRHTGPGLLESRYEECLCVELNQLGLRFKRQGPLPVSSKGIKLDCGYKMDLVVEDTVVLELKTVDQLLPVHAAQLLTYLKLSGKPVGLLINFNEPVLKKGLKRLVNRFREAGDTHVTSAPSAGQSGGSTKSRSFREALQALRLRVSAANNNLEAGVNRFREAGDTHVSSAPSAGESGEGTKAGSYSEVLQTLHLRVSAVSHRLETAK